MNGRDDTSDWFNGYVDQSITFSSWRKVEAKVSQILKQNVEKKLMEPVNRQILFQILGIDFVNKYFSSYTNSPAVLDNVRTEEKERKSAEMKAYINSVIDSVLLKNGPRSDLKVQSDLAGFSQDLQSHIEADLQEELSESKSKRKSKPDLHEKYLTGILACEPQVSEDLIPVLSSQLVVLSDNLRLCLWPACSSVKEKSKTKKNSEKNRERFSQLYKNISSSSNAKEDLKLISSSVSKVYKETNCIHSLGTEENIYKSSVVLKIYDLYGKKFQLNFVYFSILLQQVYLKDNIKSYDQDYANAAFMLDQILRLYAPNSNRTSKIVKRLTDILSEEDKQLDGHIKQKLMIRDNGSELPEGGKFESTTKGATEDTSFHLNKWISSGFVSVMKPNVSLFIWDQLYLNRWENKIFQDVCLALLGLLKPWFMVAKDNLAIQKVFLEEPGCLYLLDVRNALRHVQKRAAFVEIAPMNRNIKYTGQEPVPYVPPKPVPAVVPPVPIPEPPKPKTPPPKPVLPKPQLMIPWVPYNKEQMKEAAGVKSKVHLPFDLYIDAIRFVPDYSTVVKITGKVLNMYLGQKKFIKFHIFPELDSYWRYPKFKFKQAVNMESIPMNPDTVIMLRVYTIESHSKNICVLGSCLFGPFSNKHGKQAQLRVGGHQIRIRHGIPDPDFNVENMLASHMDDNPIIPGMTVLLRVLPHGNEFLSAIEYEKNCYRSELAKPNESEKKLYEHYKKSADISMSVRDAALLMFGQANTSNPALNQLLEKQMQKEGSDVEDFPYQRYVRYCKKHGMMVLVDKASGLPLFLEGRYLQCLVQVFPGADTKMGSGKSQVINFITNDLELDSSQRAPDWSDQPKRVNLEYDDKAFILVSLYGLRPRFDVAKQKLIDKDGREPKFNLEQAIAWSATTCFDKGSVHAGIHQIPLLKGRPSEDIIEKLSYLPLDFICKKLKTQVKVFEAASIEVSIWDGHFTNSECPPLPVHTELLNISNNPSRYIKAAQNPSGPSATDLIKSGLNDPSAFYTHSKKIVELLNSSFKTNLDNSLVKSGYKSTLQ